MFALIKAGQQGLLKEVEDLDTLARQSVSCSSADVEETASSSSQTDYTLGLYQSIGKSRRSISLLRA
jgi:hypothetical protein